MSKHEEPWCYLQHDINIHRDILSDQAFYGLERYLHALGLVSNSLTSVPVPALESLSGLTRLDLSGNRITYIDTLPRLPELEYLDLSQNNLSVVAGGWTQSTPNLRYHSYSNNNRFIELKRQINAWKWSLLRDLPFCPF